MVFRYSKRARTFFTKYVPSRSFGGHVTWNSAVPDPNVWCCILLFLCTLGGTEWSNGGFSNCSTSGRSVARSSSSRTQVHRKFQNTFHIDRWVSQTSRLAVAVDSYSSKVFMTVAIFDLFFFLHWEGGEGKESSTWGLHDHSNCPPRRKTSLSIFRKYLVSAFNTLSILALWRISSSVCSSTTFTTVEGFSSEARFPPLVPPIVHAPLFSLRDRTFSIQRLPCEIQPLFA